MELLWRLLGDPGRYVRALALVVVVLGASVGLAAILVPHLGVLGGALSGLGAGAGGTAATKMIHRKHYARGDHQHREERCAERGTMLDANPGAQSARQ